MSKADKPDGKARWYDQHAKLLEEMHYNQLYIVSPVIVLVEALICDLGEALPQHVG